MTATQGKYQVKQKLEKELAEGKVFKSNSQVPKDKLL